MLHNALKQIVRPARLVWKDSKALLRNALNNRVVAKPRVLQFPITDICNSRCVMCNIWKHKKKDEITPSQLEEILKDPLFSRIEYVGLNGGEPTLRRDLREVARALVSELPRLKKANVITNCLNAKQVVEGITDLDGVFREAGVEFQAALSLDGIGAVHDRVRGVEGNFQSAMEVADALRDKGIRFSVGSTLTPLNAWWADDLLLWAEEREVAVSLKPASVIARLDNASYANEYAFTEEQIFHLVMFFDKLSRQNSIGASSAATYQSMRDQIAGVAPRRVGCYWQDNNGVTTAMGKSATAPSPAPYSDPRYARAPGVSFARISKSVGE